MDWFSKHSLRLRLTVWHTLVVTAILGALTPFGYRLIEHRLHAELERQLSLDWNLVVAHLENDPGGRVRWRPQSPGTPDSPAYAATAFDVWLDQEKMLEHWPLAPMDQRPPALSPTGSDRYETITLVQGREARALSRSARIGDRAAVVRVFRDESDLRGTLREVLTTFLLGAPAAALLAALGGYVMAGRVLAPVKDLGRQARQISAESLSRRLNYPHPEDELGGLAAVFNETLARLESSFESLRRFSADASHELRTPLTALRAVGEVALREGNDPMALRETIGSMLEEAQRLQNLSESLLALTRIENDFRPIDAEEMDLNRLAADVCDRFTVLAAEKEQRLEVVSNRRTVALGAPTLATQAFSNIVNNAIRYSPRKSAIKLECFATGSEAGIAVTDEGPGIAPEFQEKVFERFFRLDQSRSREEGGTGLGLAIAKVFTERQGGRIELISTPGQGCCFRFILPAAPEP